MRRRFNRHERNALFLASSGLCAQCGSVLPPGWHADHAVPFSRGGPTDVVNGQALCPACNLNKGDRVGLPLRPHQQRMIQACKEKIAAGEGSVVGDIFPASGKTIGFLLSAVELWRAGVIDACSIFVPRLNLAGQAETDWERLRVGLGEADPGAIRHRENNPPLFRRERDGHEAFGYVSTYASLMMSPDLHRLALRGRRYVLILDEAQQLGLDDTGGTRSAEAVMHLVAGAAFVILVSGTPYRADGRELLQPLARYSDPDPSGTRFLLADVSSEYREGVGLGFLRRFDATMADGRGVYEYVDAGPDAVEELHLGSMTSGIGKVVTHPGFWQPMVDMTVERVREMQRLDSNYCGLIGANTQPHAVEIERYLRSRHAGVRALIATSNERAAQDNLRKFRAGGYDILITVAMAHVGYDHKPITVVCMLNSFREWGWVLQLLARGLRRIGEIPFEREVLHAICAGDPKAMEIFRWMQSESALGIKDRQQRQGNAGGFAQPRLGATRDAVMTDLSVLGTHAAGDVPSEEFGAIEQAIKKYGLGGAPRSGVAQLLREFGAHIPTVSTRAQPASPAATPQMKEVERERLKSKELHTRMVGFDRQLMAAGAPDVREGYTATACKRAFAGKGLPECSLVELDLRDDWLKNDWALTVNAMVQKYREYAAH